MTEEEFEEYFKKKFIETLRNQFKTNRTDMLKLMIQEIQLEMMKKRGKEVHILKAVEELQEELEHIRLSAVYAESNKILKGWGINGEI